MLRWFVTSFRCAAIMVIAGVLFYILSPEYGKYLLGVGLVTLAISTAFYIAFMFKRYGEKRPIE